MVAIIAHYIVGCNKGRHIASGLCRQILIDAPEVFLAARTPDSLTNISGAAVISSNGKRPVAKDVIKDVTKDVIKEISDRQLVVYGLIKENPFVTIAEMSQKTGVTTRTIKRDLECLQ